MLDNDSLLAALNGRYPMTFTRVELLREGGNSTYAVWSGSEKFFLKVAGPAFADTIKSSVEINRYLQSGGLSVPEVVMTLGGEPYVESEADLLILYAFLETTEIDMRRDAEAVGELIGRMHALMAGYPGPLVRRDRGFYIDRYLSILEKKRYPRADEFRRYGDGLWNRVRDLPLGYSHGDMYCGNIERGADGRLYALDFDTSCIGFPLYDLALVCNQTNYFAYDPEGLQKTVAVYKRLLPSYLRERKLENCGIRPLCDMLAVYHFALQATIVEIHGLDCVGEIFSTTRYRG